MGLNIGWSLGSRCPFSCLHCYTRDDRSGVRDLELEDVGRVIEFARANDVSHVTLGGNEPWFSGSGPSLLPAIVESLSEACISASLVTSGPSALRLASARPDLMALLVNVAISLDAPRVSEHNKSRGAALWSLAMEALSASSTETREPLILWVLKADSTADDVAQFADLARDVGAYLRINLLKPNSPGLEPLFPDAERIQTVMDAAATHFKTVLSTDALLDPAATQRASCPCGDTTFRIGFKQADGSIPVHACQYHRPHAPPGATVAAGSNVLEQLRVDPIAESNRTTPGCGTLRDLVGVTAAEGGGAEIEVPEQLRVWLNYLPTWIGSPR